MKALAIWMHIVLLLPCYLVYKAEAQFPSSCTDYKSLKSKTCCPAPAGFGNPCGAPHRGECTEITVKNWTHKDKYFKDFHKIDDRTNWPKLFYTKGCKCKGQFAGYDCSKCKFGYRGNDCTEKKQPLIRKDARKLTKVEKRQLHAGYEQVEVRDKRLQSGHNLL